MGQLVVMGALMTCNYGKAPVPLVVVPEGTPVTAGTFAATIADCIPIENIATFAVCSSPTNPATKNPTGQAPCVPATTPWVPGAPTVLINGVPALTSDSKCTCALGTPECIMITDPGQVIVEISG
ncbi:MAG: DUF4280 domain-containing protein [Acidimicrobiales bacterium]